MSVRVDIGPEGLIEVMRPVGNGENHHLKFDNVDSALNVLELFINEDLQRAQKERYKPKLYKEAEKIYGQMIERSPYSNGASQTAKASGNARRHPGAREPRVRVCSASG